MKKALLFLAVTAASVSSMAANPLEQFQGRYEINPANCTYAKFSDFRRAYIKLTGLKKNVIDIALYGGDAMIVDIEIDNRVETKNENGQIWTITQQAMVNGGLVQSRTTYNQNGKVTQTVDESLLLSGNRLLLRVTDTQMPRPEVCEFIKK